ncbi:MAG: hypothetical protein SVV80_02680 [Planctomycetota bacterium]|nr:hypothetical protein [Planctomycetota bacterium]
MAREYDIAKASGHCTACKRELAIAEEFVVALFDAEEGFRREDFCKPCWESRSDESAEAFSIWHSRVPRPDEPKKPLISNNVLIEFFEKLDGQDEPAKINFRFVLALMLMRKRLLVYDGSESDEEDGKEVWTMHFRGVQSPVKVIRPELDEGRIAEVGSQLGALFEMET